MTIVTIIIFHVILYCIKLTVTRKLLPTRQCNRAWTWKWDDETHLLICLKRGSTILRNSAGSMTSSSSSISPRNITCHHTHFNMEHYNTTTHRSCMPHSSQTNESRVFRLFLNCPTVRLQCRSEDGRLFHNCSPTSGPVSTGMGDHVWVQFPVPEIYLGIIIIRRRKFITHT